MRQSAFQPTGRLDGLASLALSEVALRFEVRTNTKIAKTMLIDRMLEAAMNRSGETLDAAAQGIFALGISAEYVVDEIIPGAAHRMGEEWVQDVSGFAAVTLGSFRLQTLVRKLGARWLADHSAPTLSTILLWVPESAQHTLGATVVSTKLRRLGHSVQFIPGGGLDELSQRLAEGGYDAVVVSASVSESPCDVSAIVERTKTQYPKMPVIVGGTILRQHDDLVGVTGADVATNDIEKVTEVIAT